jgi:hypothetical protein
VVGVVEFEGEKAGGGGRRGRLTGLGILHAAAIRRALELRYTRFLAPDVEAVHFAFFSNM